MEAICNKYNTKAYTPVSTNARAVDGVLLLNKELIQLKTNTFSNMITRINSAYSSAKGINVTGVHIYMEISDSNSSITSVIGKWENATTFPGNGFIVNDGTISAITVKTNTGWVDLDLSLIK